MKHFRSAAWAVVLTACGGGSDAATAKSPAPTESASGGVAAPTELDAACKDKIDATVKMDLTGGNADVTVEFAKSTTPEDMQKLGLRAQSQTWGSGTVTREQTIALCKDADVKMVGHKPAVMPSAK